MYLGILTLLVFLTFDFGLELTAWRGGLTWRRDRVEAGALLFSGSFKQQQQLRTLQRFQMPIKHRLIRYLTSRRRPAVAYNCSVDDGESCPSLLVGGLPPFLPAHPTFPSLVSGDVLTLSVLAQTPHEFFRAGPRT
jgi:hypothetical protein